MQTHADYKVGCDVHKRYSVFAVLNGEGRLCQQAKVDHHPGAIRGFVATLPPGTPVAVESVGHWYWVVDEIEAGGGVPLLVHAARARWMMGRGNKTDKLDAAGLARLLQAGTLPTVWLPPGEVRDARELPRTRMGLVQQRTRLKNRVQATLARYALSLEGVGDVFAPGCRGRLLARIAQLPPETRRCTEQVLALIDELQAQIEGLEARIRARVKETPTLRLLTTLPGVGDILAIVIAVEMGSVERFPGAGHFASYAGLTPRVYSSGGRVRHGRMRREANLYLKWAFIEAANVVARYHTHPKWRERHVTRLYLRLRRRKGHRVAVGAVARHLAEAAYHVVKRGEPYREPQGGRPGQG